MEHVHYLIVGAGMAADAAAKAIREADATANIDIDLATANSGAQLHLGRCIESLDRIAHTVRDDHGDSYRYRRLLLAIGATPRRLPFDGGELVIHFRTLDDYLALRRFAVEGAHIAVIGGGFIGSELAASLCSIGCKVTMLFPAPAIGAGRYPDGLSAFLNGYFHERGVSLRTGVTVADGKTLADTVELPLSAGITCCGESVRAIDVAGNAG